MKRIATLTMITCWAAVAFIFLTACSIPSPIRTTSLSGPHMAPIGEPETFYSEEELLTYLDEVALGVCDLFDRVGVEHTIWAIHDDPEVPDDVRAKYTSLLVYYAVEGYCPEHEEGLNAFLQQGVQ